MAEIFCICCEFLAPIFSCLQFFPNTCCNCCDCCGSGIDDKEIAEYWRIPESDLDMTAVRHKDNVYFLMTDAQKAPHEKKSKSGMGFQWDDEVLDAIPPEDRIMVTDVMPVEGHVMAGHEALRMLLIGIQEKEARELLGSDGTSLEALLKQGITTPAKLREWKVKQKSMQ